MDAGAISLVRDLATRTKLDSELDSSFDQLSESELWHLAATERDQEAAYHSRYAQWELATGNEHDSDFHSRLAQCSEAWKRCYLLRMKDLVSFFPSPCPNYIYHVDPVHKANWDEVAAASAISHAISSFAHEKSEYHHGMKEVPKISVDKPVDVIALLSSHDKTVERDFLVNRYRKKVPITSLRGKHLLICCFHLPIFSQSSAAAVCRALISLNSELPKKVRETFQVVIVPKLTRGSPPYFPPFSGYVLEDFFSAFPDNFLAIPPSDYQSCDYVCDSIILSARNRMGLLYVDPEEMVLLKSVGMTSTLERYGAAAFPYTKRHVEDLFKKDRRLRLRLDAIYKEHNSFFGDRDKLCSDRVSLEELLECHFLTNMDEDNKKEVPLSYFKDKLVGIYLFCDGRFMFELANVHEDCIDEGRSFEIVLICLDHRDEPSSILKHVRSSLDEEGFPLSNWWTFPYSHKVSHKLWHLCDCDDMDKMIILRPPGSGDEVQSGDLQGKAVIREFGGSSAYPFTRQAILDRKLSLFGSLTLEKLLKGSDLVGNEDENRKKVPVADLLGKQVLLYLDRFSRNDKKPYLYDEVHDLYLEIQAKHPDSEVVFVPLNEPSSNASRELVSEMPWLRLPFPSPSVSDELDLGRASGCVAFGKDGRLLSRKANWHLKTVDCLFKNRMRKEIVSELYVLHNEQY